MSEYTKDTGPRPANGPPAGEPGPRRPLPDTLSPRLVLGLFIVALGVVFFLDQLGYRVGAVVRWWPLALVVIGALKAWQPRGTPGRTFGWVLIVLGALLLLDNVTAFELEFALLWPALVVAAGGALVWQALQGSSRRDPGSAVAGDGFSAVAVLGSARRRVTSSAFRRGDATAVLGGCEIDLRQARLGGGEAVVDVFCLWGGVDLLVPDDWQVELRGTPVLGGFDDNTRPRAGSDGRLTVTGVAIMGGVDVKSG